MTRSSSPTLARIKPDAVGTAAVDFARTSLLETVDAADVGDHLGYVVEGERLGSHLFECLRAGYRGWRWSVTITRASRQKSVTLNEVVLIPGEEAIIAPVWVPYRERVQPGDLSPGDLLPVADDDPRLVPAYSFGDGADSLDDLSVDEKAQIGDVEREVGIGRVRTLSPEGRQLAAQRWYDGAGGPEAPLAQSAPRQCGTCGFLLRVTGPLSRLFGVCANGDANDDGRVVAFDHGCGAHSEVQLAKRNQPQPLPEHAIDTLTDDLEPL
ncbi:MAG: DUF3027 domain-containing protein [Nocardioides sp.]